MVQEGLRRSPQSRTQVTASKVSTLPRDRSRGQYHAERPPVCARSRNSEGEATQCLQQQQLHPQPQSARLLRCTIASCVRRIEEGERPRRHHHPRHRQGKAPGRRSDLRRQGQVERRGQGLPARREGGRPHPVRQVLRHRDQASTAKSSSSCAKKKSSASSRSSGAPRLVALFDKQATGYRLRATGYRTSAHNKF